MEQLDITQLLKKEAGCPQTIAPEPSSPYGRGLAERMIKKFHAYLNLRLRLPPNRIILKLFETSLELTNA